VQQRELTMAGLAKQTSVCGVAVAALFASSLALAAMVAGDAFAEGYNNQGSSQAPGAAAPAQMTPQPPAPAPSSAQPPSAAAPLVPSQPDPANRPGFLHQLKVWWDDSVALFDAKSKDARGSADDTNKKPDDTGRSAADAAKDAAKNAATATQDAMKNAVEATKGAATTATDAMKGAVEATKNAATAIVRLPNTRVVDVRETCARAPNGASDCAAAAANGCRTKGFNGGTPLDTRTAEKCDTKPPQAGQMPGLRCAPETVVVRAVCQ
jgi:type IV secretory pathway VirB10-like protein